MTSKLHNDSRLLNSGNFAFVIVVCAAYASATAALIYSRSSLPSWEIALLVAAALAYLLVGTYGFMVCRQSGSMLAATAYFITQLLLATTLILLRGSSGELSLILLPLAGQSALLLPPRLMVPVCAAIYLALVMPLVLGSRWIDAVAIAIMYGTGIVFVVVFTRVATSERDARERLSEANRKLQEHAEQIEELATTKERNRLAREIHDSVGHYLTVVNVQIGAAQAVLTWDEPRARDHLAKAQTLTQEGLKEVRRSVAALRAPSIEDRPLTDALATLVEQWNASGTSINFTVKGVLRPLSPQADLTLYRTAQEALTNVGRHASAERVEITLEYDDSTVRLEVADDGLGSTSSERGFGLLGVGERVQLLGGDMRVETGIGMGFSLKVELPL